MTVLVNGRSIVHRGSGGKLVTISVNFTGPQCITVPYQNIAYTRHLTNTPTNVKVNGEPVATLKSYIMTSIGDEAGTLGGIFSGTVNGRAEFVTHSPDTFINGDPVIRAGDLAVSNCRNTAPAPIQQ